MVSLDHFALITTHAASFLTSTSRASLPAARTAVVGSAAVVTTKRSKMSASLVIEECDNNAMQMQQSASVPQTQIPTIELTQNTIQHHNPIIHFCFIVHGHQGRPTDLSYLHSAVKSKAKEGGIFADAKSSDSCVVGQATQVEVGTGTGTGTATGTTAVATNKNETALRRRRKRDRLPFSRKKKEVDSERNNNPQEGSAIIDAIDGDGQADTQSSSNNNKGTLVVHNAACNEGKTHDGIVKGGERLADEMLHVIRSEVAKQKQQQLHQKQNEEEQSKRKNDAPDVDDQRGFVDVTISIVGNSLGGLYGRYAIAHLDEVLDDPPITPSRKSDEAKKAATTATTSSTCSYHLLDGNIRIHFNVFCSTASPHLGCASHTYFPIPRMAEIGVAQIMGETGSDLFRVNDLVQTMATSPRFLKPLASFRRRIAYANAYGTDFPVPGATAAFLNKGSDYPHYFDDHFVENDNSDMATNVEDGSNGGAETASLVERVMTNQRQERQCPASEKGLIVATVHTPRLPMEEHAQVKDTLDKNDLTAMSSSLDSLGWKKIFVDIRNEIPMTVHLPTLSKAHCPIEELKLKSNNSGVVRSCDLEKAISGSNGYKLSLPLGHNAICAFSRGTVSTTVNSGGRPVMDSLSIDLTDEISSWDRVS